MVVFCNISKLTMSLRRIVAGAVDFFASRMAWICVKSLPSLLQESLDAHNVKKVTEKSFSWLMNKTKQQYNTVDNTLCCC